MPAEDAMSTIIAYQPIDARTFDLHGADADSSVWVLDNFPYTTPTPAGYTDDHILLIDYWGTPAHTVQWYGEEVTDSGDIPNSGTFTGLYDVVYAPDNRTSSPFVEITGFAVPVVSAWHAMQSATLADDQALLAVMLAGGDYFALSTGNDIADGKGGHDTMSGRSGDDTLFGGGGHDRLDGGFGADSLVGGTGDDTYAVAAWGDRVIEAASGGVDTVRSARDYNLGANLENLALIGNEALDGKGNALANALTGNAGANRLEGRGGADTLDGGPGADTLAGGRGDDLYFVGGYEDTIVELSRGGIDTVMSSGSRTLGDFQENLVLTGSARWSGWGNGRANLIIGNAKDNLLSGRIGNDTLDGGGGTDQLAGGQGANLFRFSAPGAHDVVVDFVSAVDRLEFGHAAFTALGATGPLAADAFRLDATAADSGDRIVYDSATGSLWYDANGNGSAAALLVATFEAGTPVARGDLWVG